MASMRCSASRISPVAPYFFLIASSSSSLRSLNRSSNLVSKRVLVVQRGIGGFAFIQNLQAWRRHSPHPSSDRYRYTRQSACRVFFSPWRSVISGVPVKAMRVALGKASNRLSPKIRALGAVRLVDHQNDALGVIHHAKGLAGRHGLISAQRFGHLQCSGLLRSWNLCTITMLMSELSVAKCRRRPLRVLDDIDPAADQGGGFAQLVFQIDAVIDQHNLVIVQIALKRAACAPETPWSATCPNPGYATPRRCAASAFRRCASAR